MEILHLVKDFEILYQLVYTAPVKSVIKNILNVSKLGCLSFPLNLKRLCILSVNFHCCFFFAGEITMVETGPVLAFQDCCPGLKKIR